VAKAKKKSTASLDERLARAFAANPDLIKQFQHGGFTAAVAAHPNLIEQLRREEIEGAEWDKAAKKVLDGIYSARRAAPASTSVSPSPKLPSAPLKATGTVAASESDTAAFAAMATTVRNVRQPIKESRVLEILHELDRQHRVRDDMQPAEVEKIVEPRYRGDVSRRVIARAYKKFLKERSAK
jgi:hypothetical protein